MIDTSAPMGAKPMPMVVPPHLTYSANHYIFRAPPPRRGALHAGPLLWRNGRGGHEVAQPPKLAPTHGHADEYVWRSCNRRQRRVRTDAIVGRTPSLLHVCPFILLRQASIHACVLAWRTCASAALWWRPAGGLLGCR